MYKINSSADHNITKHHATWHPMSHKHRRYGKQHVAHNTWHTASTHLDATSNVFTDGKLVLVPSIDWHQQVKTVFFVNLQ